MSKIIFSQLTKEELVSEIVSQVSDSIRNHNHSSNDFGDYLTAKETEGLLKISNVTRWKWTNQGILKGYKIGSRLRYKKSEVLSAMKELESRKNYLPNKKS